MSNTYQKRTRHAEPDRLPGEMTIPEQVVVSMAEIAESAKEGLLALAVGTGLQVMAAMFAEDAGRLCGPGGKHNPDRAGYRHGTGQGSVTLGGRRLPVTRPRVRAADGSGSCTCPAMTCSPRPRSWAGWPWRRCWPGCRRAATQPGWSPPGRPWSRWPRLRRSRRCRAGSWPRPRPPWLS